MSAFGGIWNFDGAEVDGRVLRVLARALESRGPDGGGEFKENSIGMVQRAFHTTTDAEAEVQPLDLKGHVMCWDGRLDNRQDLRSILRDVLCDDQTDVGLVLKAFIHWGLPSVSRLIGDFAFCSWDPFESKLYLVRDPGGARPLFYQINKNQMVWSSELEPLIKITDTDVEVNDEYIAGFLTRGEAPGLTPYKNICSVPPGHIVIISPDKIRTQQFWRPSPDNQIRYGTDLEYEEHFRHLFREAVRCRMRVKGTVWVQLSGGLDSSAIVCMADDILHSGEAEARKVTTVSYTYEESSTSDETEFISCVEDKRGRTGYHLDENDLPPLSYFPEHSFIPFPNSIDCFIERHHALADEMRSSGARVLMTGHGGDEILCSSANPSPQLQDLLMRCQPVRLHRTLHRWSHASNRSYLDLLWREALLPILPATVRVLLPLKPHHQLPSWYAPRFVNRMKMRERYLATSDLHGFRLRTARDQAANFYAAATVVSRAAYRSRACIEVSHPYLHRPLVEFLQAIPFEQRLRPGETRSLMRRALRHLLPAKVLQRRTKSGSDEAFARAVARQWPRLQKFLASPKICERAYVNREAFISMCERLRHGCERYSFDAIKSLSLEFWLRALEHQKLVSAELGELETLPAALPYGTASTIQVPVAGGMPISTGRG